METRTVQAKPVKKNFDAIDIVKLIATMFVVGIHTEPFASVSDDLNFAVFRCISRFAVPFFFVSSSFFFFRGGVTKEKLKHYEKRMAILYLTWFILSFPITFDRKYSGFLEVYSLGGAILNAVRGFLFTSSFRGSWYLASSMFCAAVIYLLSKRLSNRGLFVFASIAYAFCVVCSTYGELFYYVGLGEFFNALNTHYGHPYTSIITGLLYFVIGKYFAEHEQTMTESNTLKYGLLSALTMVGIFFEIHAAKWAGLMVSSDCCFMIIPNAYFLMRFVLGLRIEVSNKKLLRSVRASGVIVFLVHFSVLHLLQKSGWEMNTMIRYVLILVISFAFADLVLRMENKRFFRWMHYLH